MLIRTKVGQLFEYQTIVANNMLIAVVRPQKRNEEIVVISQIKGIVQGVTATHRGLTKIAFLENNDKWMLVDLVGQQSIRSVTEIRGANKHYTELEVAFLSSYQSRHSA